MKSVNSQLKDNFIFEGEYTNDLLVYGKQSQFNVLRKEFTYQSNGDYEEREILYTPAGDNDGYWLHLYQAQGLQSVLISSERIGQAGQSLSKKEQSYDARGNVKTIRNFENGELSTSQERGYNENDQVISEDIFDSEGNLTQRTVNEYAPEGYLMRITDTFLPSGDQTIITLDSQGNIVDVQQLDQFGNPRKQATQSKLKQGDQRAKRNLKHQCRQIEKNECSKSKIV